MMKLPPKAPANFATLWNKLKTVAEVNHDDGLKATLMNHERRKEYICRKLGVVTDADVNRIADQIAKKAESRNKAGIAQKSSMS